MANHLRFATPDDAARIADIYAYYVLNTTASFEYTPPDAAETAERMAAVTATYPYLVFEREGVVVAYAYASRFREREAYKYGAQLSIYIDEAYHGNGIGRALYGALLDLLAAQGIYNVYAGITLPNEKSVGLHRAMGFKEVGVYHSTGYKFGRWLDVMHMEKALNAYQDVPEPVLSIHALNEANKEAILARYYS
ncbi:MAG: GNAT family N-acetyltransferase [Oscillospiraceae bacterium]|nr:GNAT family N-acetyltransferase [Oscillospiraceae bacterium]